MGRSPLSFIWKGIEMRTISELASCIAQSDMGRSLPFISFPLLGSVVPERREVSRGTIVTRGVSSMCWTQFSVNFAWVRKGVVTTTTATRGARRARGPRAPRAPGPQPPAGRRGGPKGQGLGMAISSSRRALGHSLSGEEGRAHEAC